MIRVIIRSMECVGGLTKPMSCAVIVRILPSQRTRKLSTASIRKGLIHTQVSNGKTSRHLAALSLMETERSVLSVRT